MATSNVQLVEQLVSDGVLHTPLLTKAFRDIDRKDFVLAESLEEVYEDISLPIGFDQTISQPSTVAFMLELLEPQAGQNILDVGSGSGWTTALLAAVVGREGKVCGVELIPELVAYGQENLAKYTYEQAEIHQSGEELGLPEQAPFDRILVSATAAEIPQPLVDQLKTGGIMVIPIGNKVCKVTKLPDGNLETEEHKGFVFVPLIRYHM